MHKYMYKCNDCKIENESPNGWYADYTETGKRMRCPSCGEKELNKREKMFYGDRKPFSFEEIDKQDRINHAKDLRKAGLSPWTYRKVEG